MANGPEQLAILGGTPVRTRPWPKWPRGTQGGQRNLFDALHSGKWAISGTGERTNSYEARFGRTFANYTGRHFGVPCSSGTSALTIALQALGIGPGSAVIVPGLTWIACATAVLNLGAVPVLCDVDEDSLCVAPDSLDEAMQRVENVRAVEMVHMYGSICDIDGFLAKANKYSLALIEDGSQSHGGRWRGQPIGSFGAISAFSFQHSKLLTCGEGGIAVTNDEELNRLLQEYRADGRVYTGYDSRVRREFGYELEVRGDVVGRNLCLSEFQAAVALDALEYLDAETSHREVIIEHLRVRLKSIPGVRISACPQAADVRPYYRVAVHLNRHFAGEASIAMVAIALSKELNTDVRTLDMPLDANPLYQPHRHFLVTSMPTLAASLSRASVSLPNARAAFNSTITFPHQLFLSSADDVEDIVKSLEKLRRAAEQNPRWYLDIDDLDIDTVCLA